MNIETSLVGIDHQNTQIIGRGNYVFHNVDAYSTMIINGSAFEINFQCGQSFYNNDYDRPRPDLDISDHGTDDFIYMLEQLTEKDIETMSDDDLVEWSEHCDSIKTKEDLMQVYKEISYLKIEASTEFESYKTENNLSDDADDYFVPPGEYYAELKDKN